MLGEISIDLFYKTFKFTASTKESGVDLFRKYYIYNLQLYNNKFKDLHTHTQKKILKI